MSESEVRYLHIVKLQLVCLQTSAATTILTHYIRKHVTGDRYSREKVERRFEVGLRDESRSMVKLCVGVQILSIEPNPAKCVTDVRLQRR
jgi:hypothetical protein